MLHRLTNTGEAWQKEQARQMEILSQTAKMVESISTVQSQLTQQLEKLQRDNAKFPESQVHIPEMTPQLTK